MKRSLFALAALMLGAASCTTELIENEKTQTEVSMAGKLIGKTSAEIEQGTLLVKLDEQTSRQLAEGADLNTG